MFEDKTEIIPPIIGGILMIIMFGSIFLIISGINNVKDGIVIEKYIDNYNEYKTTKKIWSVNGIPILKSVTVVDYTDYIIVLKAIDNNKETTTWYVSEQVFGKAKLGHLFNVDEMCNDKDYICSLQDFNNKEY